MKKYTIYVEFESGLKNQFTVEAESRYEAMRKGREMIINPSINYGYEYWAEEIKAADENAQLKERLSSLQVENAKLKDDLSNAMDLAHIENQMTEKLEAENKRLKEALNRWLKLRVIEGKGYYTIDANNKKERAAIEQAKAALQQKQKTQYTN